MRRWYAILRCEATTITRERTYQDARDRDILFWWCESMSLFFYDVCLSSKLKLVFWWNSRWRKNCRFCTRVKIFSSSLLCCILSALFICSLFARQLPTTTRKEEKERQSCPNGVVFLVIFSCYRRLYPTTLPAPWTLLYHQHRELGEENKQVLHDRRRRFQKRRGRSEGERVRALPPPV